MLPQHCHKKLGAQFSYYTSSNFVAVRKKEAYSTHLSHTEYALLVHPAVSTQTLRPPNAGSPSKCYSAALKLTQCH